MLSNFSPMKIVFATSCIALSLAVSACVPGSPTSGLTFEKDQGSSENIGSLTRVVNANPQDPTAYNIRGSAYGRAGRFSAALNDFNTAISLNRSTVGQEI